MTDAIAALAAWKLGLTDIDPRATVRLTSSNSLSRYAAGTAAKLPALAGHDDGYMTTCPGAALHARCRRSGRGRPGSRAGPEPPESQPPPSHLRPRYTPNARCNTLPWLPHRPSPTRRGTPRPGHPPPS